MATKTFVPQTVKEARRITRYDGKHHAKLAANLTGGGQLTAWNALVAAAQAYEAVVTEATEEP